MDNSLIEAPLIPKWAKDYRDAKFFIYNGPSMAPLFKPGDLLCASQPVLEKIRPGDIVIVYWGSKTYHFDHIVHRVISVKRDHLITRGDNNLKTDPRIVTMDNLVGLVTAFERRGQIYSTRGGSWGLFYACLVFSRNRIGSLCKRLNWRLYRLVRQSGLVAFFWKPSFLMVWLAGEYGPWVKFVHSGRTIARWWPKLNRFECRKPFDLVLQRENLPDEKFIPH